MLKLKTRNQGRYSIFGKRSLGAGKNVANSRSLGLFIGPRGKGREWRQKTIKILRPTFFSSPLSWNLIKEAVTFLSVIIRVNSLPLGLHLTLTYYILKEVPDRKRSLKIGKKVAYTSEVDTHRRTPSFTPVVQALFSFEVGKGMKAGWISNILKGFQRRSRDCREYRKRML